MTITRCLRSLAAAALAAGLVLPAAASAAGGPGGKHGGPGGHGAPSYNTRQRHRVDGVLQPMSGTTVPATLTVQAGTTTNPVTITVTVSATTRLLRGHGGRCRYGLAELTAGDHVTAWGSFEKGSTTTFDARQIRDGSIAYKRVGGTVAGVSSGGVTGVTLRLARGGSSHSRSWRGDEVYVTWTSSTIVTSGSITMTVGAVNWAQTPALHVRVTGLYDSAINTYHPQPTLLADSVRILGTTGRREPVATPTP